MFDKSHFVDFKIPLDYVKGFNIMLLIMINSPLESKKQSDDWILIRELAVKYNEIACENE
jgi:hypothetical protein